MKKNQSGFLTFLVGGIAGAVVALLYAPQSGEDTRQNLIDTSQKVKKDALDAIQVAQTNALAKLNEAQARIDTINVETKERLASLKEVGKTAVVEQKDILEEGYKKAKEVIAA